MFILFYSQNYLRYKKVFKKLTDLIKFINKKNIKSHIQIYDIFFNYYIFSGYAEDAQKKLVVY